MIESRLVVARAKELEELQKKCEETFQDENIFSSCDGGNITVYSKQNSSNCTVRMGDFIICKIHLNNVWGNLSREMRS